MVISNELGDMGQNLELTIVNRVIVNGRIEHYHIDVEVQAINTFSEIMENLPAGTQLAIKESFSTKPIYVHILEKNRPKGQITLVEPDNNIRHIIDSKTFDYYPVFIGKIISNEEQPTEIKYEEVQVKGIYYEKKKVKTTYTALRWERDQTYLFMREATIGKKVLIKKSCTDFYYEEYKIVENNGKSLTLIDSVNEKTLNLSVFGKRITEVEEILLVKERSQLEKEEIL